MARLLAALAAVALLAAVACSGDDGGDEGDGGDGGDAGATATTGETGEDAEGDGGASTGTTPPAPVEVAAGDHEAFQAPPEPIPDLEPGTLVRHQDAGASSSGARMHRVMYASRTVPGEPTVVTGVVAVPPGEPPAGGWPVLTHGHGSTGLADDCAPSRAIGDGSGPALSAAELQLVVDRATAAGFVVASSDYEGLGGPGRHPFLVGVSEGRGLLDAARAASGVPGVELDGRLVVAGYSQGGHAALWARQLAAEWAPELDLVGTVAGAPATELVAMLREGGEGTLQGPGAVIAAAGMAAADPDLDLDAVLTPAGAELLAAVEGRCGGSATSAGDGPLVTGDLTTMPGWSDALVANEPGRQGGTGPLLIVHGAEDANVPVEGSAALLARVCERGEVAERRVVPTGDHVATAVPTYDMGVAWLRDLLAGEEPTSSCP